MAYENSTAPRDGCPSCGTRNNEAVHVETDDNGCAALYRCRTCLHSWTTEWADGWPGGAA